jgi:hypothetical protein
MKTTISPKKQEYLGNPKEIKKRLDETVKKMKKQFPPKFISQNQKK